MRTIETGIYEYDELSATAKEKAVENLADLNVCYDWWQQTYDWLSDEFGVQVQYFTEHETEIELIYGHEDTAKKILNAGITTPECGLVQSAKKYMEELENIRENPKYQDDECDNGLSLAGENALENAQKELEKDIAEDVRITLNMEYEYLTSTEQIEESIRANEYEFTVDGGELV